VRHPEHVKDVARAFSWTCDNVRKYGGDPGRIVVGGHSAGGHLVSLLVTDESYLKAEGRSANDVRGVAAVSGVYCLNDLACEWRFGGPEKGECLNLRASLFYPVFGADPDELKRASPVTYARPGLPPFLLLNGGLDYYPLRGMTRRFAAELRKNGCDVRTKVLPWRTHETALFDVARLDSDVVTRGLILDFVEEVAGGKKTR
jgi:acetyl esterase/lipase